MSDVNVEAMQHWAPALLEYEQETDIGTVTVVRSGAMTRDVRGLFLLASDAEKIERKRRDDKLRYTRKIDEQRATLASRDAEIAELRGRVEVLETAIRSYPHCERGEIGIQRYCELFLIDAAEFAKHKS